MMMDCPRCSFSQPKDRYCANCGLDVDGYKPVPDSTTQKLFKNMSFQISAVGVVILVLAYGIYSAQTKKLNEQLLEAEQNLIATQTTSQPQNSPENPAVDESQAPTTGESSQPQEANVINKDARPNASLAANPGAAANATSTNPAAATAANGASESVIKGLRLQFIEISRIAVEQLAAENQMLDRSGTTYSFVIMSQPQVTALAPNVRTLPGSSQQAASENKKFEIAFQNPQSPFSFVLEGQTLAVTEQDVEFDIISQISLRDATSEAVSNINFNGKYTLPKNSTLVIVGLIPHQLVRQEDLQFLSGTPLSIMASAAFKNSSSEFALIVQPQ